VRIGERFLALDKFVRMCMLFSERQNDVVFVILIFSSLNSSTEQIAKAVNKLSAVNIVSTLFLQALTFLIPAIHLDPEHISSPCPNSTLFCIRICSLIDVCSSIFSSIISPHCICFFFFVICVKGADVTFIYSMLLD